MFALLAQYSSSGSDGSAVASAVISLLVAGAFGLWTANAAERKGYSRTAAFVVGFLFGIFGRIGYGLAPDRRLRSQIAAEGASGNAVGFERLPVPPSPRAREQEWR